MKKKILFFILCVLCNHANALPVGLKVLTNGEHRVFFYCDLYTQTPVASEAEQNCFRQFSSVVQNDNWLVIVEDIRLDEGRGAKKKLYDLCAESLRSRILPILKRWEHAFSQGTCLDSFARASALSLIYCEQAKYIIEELTIYLQKLHGECGEAVDAETKERFFALVEQKLVAQIYKALQNFEKYSDESIIKVMTQVYVDVFFLILETNLLNKITNNNTKDVVVVAGESCYVNVVRVLQEMGYALEYKMDMLIDTADAKKLKMIESAQSPEDLDRALLGYCLNPILCDPAFVCGSLNLVDLHHS